MRLVSDEYLDRIVDEETLAEYLEAELGPVTEFEIERHQAGHSNETLFITWGNQEFVLRRPPPGKKADTAHDVLREYRVMDALQKTDVRVPTTVLACDDHDVIGSDFYLMERERGDVIRNEEPDRFAAPDCRQQIGEELVDQLAKIHAVDYEVIGLGDFGRPKDYTERQVERWHKQFDWAFDVTASERAVPEIKEVGSWLNDNVPDSYSNTLIHGDYKLDNVMFGPDEVPDIVGIFD